METQAITVRLPQDVYENLRLEAFRARTSQNAIIVEELSGRYRNSEELYIEQAVPDAAIDGMAPGVLESLREHMKASIAVEAIKNNSITLALPREITDHPVRGITRIRLIVPVRRMLQEEGRNGAQDQ